MQCGPCMTVYRRSCCPADGHACIPSWVDRIGCQPKSAKVRIAAIAATGYWRLRQRVAFQVVGERE
jgi:hypothetical protein